MPVELPESVVDERLAMSIAELGLSVRTQNFLEARKIFTVNDLVHKTRGDLLSIPGFGDACLEEVYKGLEGIGFMRTNRPQPDVAS